MEFTVTDISTGSISLNESSFSRTAGAMTQSYINKTLSVVKELYENTQKLLKNTLKQTGKYVLWFPEDLHVKHHFDPEDEDAWVFIIGISVCNKNKLGRDLWDMVLHSIENDWLPSGIGRSKDILIWQITNKNAYLKLLDRVKTGEDIPHILRVMDYGNHHRQSLHSLCEYMEEIPLLKDIVVSAYKTVERF